MRITSVVVAVCVIGIVMLGFTNLIQGFAQNYNVTTPINNSQFNSTFNKIENMYNTTRDVEDNVVGTQVQQTGIVDFFTTLSSGIYKSAKLILGSFGLFDTMVNEAGLALHLPSYVIGSILTIILISMLGWFLFAVFRIPS